MPVVRMEADVQNQGFAAGLAAGMSARKNLTVRDVDIQELKRMLCSMGNLPAGVLYEQDGYDPERVVPEFAEFAEAFRDPESAIPRLCEKLSETGDPEIAALLAFLKNDSGRKCLLEDLEKASWDKGWEYRGMGQFGAAVSVLDAKLIALANIADGSEKETLLRLLGELTPEHEFSHFRAVSILLQSVPDPEAIPMLEKLLKTPLLADGVENSFKKIVEQNSPDPCDNVKRTCQLKELYLLKALAACDPENPLAKERLAAYAAAPAWLYASWCGRR